MQRILVPGSYRVHPGQPGQGASAELGWQEEAMTNKRFLPGGRRTRRSSGAGNSGASLAVARPLSSALDPTVRQCGTIANRTVVESSCPSYLSQS